MKWAKLLCLVLALVAAPAALLAQTGRVTGTVTDTASGMPIVSATINVVSKPNVAAISDGEGQFSLSSVPAGLIQLRLQRIGFAPRVISVTVTAGQTVVVRAALRAVAVQLGAVVSVGYGSQNKRDVTGSVSDVSTAALERAPIVSVDQILQGTSPGVQVGTASSEPGGAMMVRIRGTSSITGSGEPLYVIDGFPIENDISGLSVGNGGRKKTTPANPLVGLNPSDIESISILKDASSTAIYGARGANGVVIINTKQGRGTKPVFTLDYTAGMATVARRYEMLNAAQYMDFANAYALTAATPYTPYPDSVRQRIVASGVDTDWQDQIYRTGGTRNLQLAVRGATNAVSTTRYALSGGIFGQDGTLIGSGLQRLSTRFNLNQMIGTRVQLAGSFSANVTRTKATNTQGQQTDIAGAPSAAMQYPPIMPVKRADGTWSLINPDLTLFDSRISPNLIPNPVSLTKDVTDSLTDTRLLSNVFAQVELLDNLKLKVSGGIDYANRGRKTYYPRTTLLGATVGGDAFRAGATATSWLNENTLTYERKLSGAQQLSLLGGYTRQSTDFEGFNTENTNFVSDITGFNSIGVGAQLGGPTVSSRRSTQTLESWLGRANYSLRDKYLLTATVRRDGSSRFAANKKWGLFPSFALAWRASAEPMLAQRKWIDDLKFRLTYGTVGNPSIRPYQSLARFGSGYYAYNGTQVGAPYPVSTANPDLTWESTASVDFGVDFAFLNRFTLTADYYTKKTTDLLLQIDLPIESGYRSALANRGSVQNKGIEVGFDAVLLKPAEWKGLGWRANLNFASNTNKVLDLGGPQTLFAEQISSDTKFVGTEIKVGQPVGLFYGFKTLGVVRDSAAAAAVTWLNFAGTTFKPGDLLVKDVDGDGRITLSDRTEIGNPIPKFTVGLTNTLTWRRFELTSLLQGSYGNKILNLNRLNMEASPIGNITLDRWKNAWTPTNPNGKYPRLGENPNQLSTNMYDTPIEDGSYLRLRAMTLSFQLPDALAMRSQLSGARMFITGTNLFTITNYFGYDPDVSSQSVDTGNRGIDTGAYPLSRSFSIGLTLNF